MPLPLHCIPEVDFRTPWGALVVCAALFFTAPVAVGQEVPRLQYESVDRGVFARVTSVPDFDEDEVTDTTEGAFAQAAAAALTTHFGSGSAHSFHRSEVTDLGICLDFDGSYEGTVGQSNLGFVGRSTLSAVFQVTEPITTVLSGSVELSEESGAAVQIVVFGAGVNLDFDGSEPGGEPIQISETVVLSPGFSYLFSVTALVDESIFDESSEGTIRLDLELDTGDADFDGLPDLWEESGIDVDGDGVAEIDLPAYGADPMRKDIFIEVDVQAGSNFPLGELSRAVDAFADAPVPNPDGSMGITLHPIFDELELPTLTYTNPDVEVAAQKETYFGTVAERNHPDWESDIREAKLRSFRYGVIGGVRADSASGWGEIVGDDFIVTTEDKVGWDVDDRISTFMHELGHNLGLRHGGGDDVNWKPNYFSVMNYLFQLPTQVQDRINWQLDYSRARLALLDEVALDELQGFGGPSPYYDDKYSLVNTATSGSSPDNEKVALRAGVPADFDGDGEIDTSSVRVDVNWFSTTLDATPDQLLRGHNDWANVSLGFSGSGNFGAGVSGGETTSSLEEGELTTEDAEMIAEIYAGLSDATAIEDDGVWRRSRVRLSAPWPNPIDDQVHLTYSIPVRADVDLAIYDLLGRRVATVVRTEQAAGLYVASWPGDAEGGRTLANGPYVVALRVQGPGVDETATQTMVVLR